jgi:hypothetical protein
MSWTPWFAAWIAVAESFRRYSKRPSTEELTLTLLQQRAVALVGPLPLFALRVYSLCLVAS